MHLLGIPNRKTGPETWATYRKRAWQLIVWRLLLALVVMSVGGAAPIAYAAKALASSIGDAVSTFAYTQNMHPMGFSERSIPLDNTVPGQGVFNSDITF